MALISACTAWARSWIFEKCFPARADLTFGKGQKSHEAKSGEYGRCSIKWIPLSSRYACVMRALWGTALALSWCNWIRAVDWICRRNLVKLTCVICGSGCSFVGHHVDNNRPLSTEEIGEHSLLERKPVFRTSGRSLSSATHTMSECLSFIVKKEIRHSSPVTTSENLLGPSGSNSCNQLRRIVTLCSFCSVVNWWGIHLAHLLDQPSCSWTIACADFRSLHQAPRLRIWVL